MSYPPGGPAAPNYGQPPRKNRAGLIITLLVALLIGVLITGGVLVVRLVSGREKPPTGRTSVVVRTPDPSPKLPSKTVSLPTGKPTTKPSTRPSATQQPARSPEPPGAGVTNLARRFVAQLNANNPTAATALACRSAKQVIPFLMRQYLKPPTRLTTGTTPIGQQITFVVQLSGTTKGATVSGIVVIQQLAPEPICVRAFSVSPG